MPPVNVFIGYDPRQPLASQVAAYSVWKHANASVAITRLDLSKLPITRRGLTEFTYSRFLVPYLSGFAGVSIFLDSDVLVRGDIVELLAYPLAYPNRAVFFVDHKQAKFERPSVMVFNNALITNLTPEYIDNPKHALFDFSWLDDGTLEKAGYLPPTWNHLVGYDAPNPDAKLVHFTQGVPCWPETRNCEHADEWVQTAMDCMETVSFNTLMGRSVHVEHVHRRLQQAAAPLTRRSHIECV